MAMRLLYCTPPNRDQRIWIWVECVCVCACACVYALVCVCVPVHACLCMSIVCICMYVCMYVCRYVCMYVGVCVFMHTTHYTPLVKSSRSHIWYTHMSQVPTGDRWLGCTIKVPGDLRREEEMLTSQCGFPNVPIFRIGSEIRWIHRLLQLSYMHTYMTHRLLPRTTGQSVLNHSHLELHTGWRNIQHRPTVSSSCLPQESIACRPWHISCVEGGGGVRGWGGGTVSASLW